MYSILNDLLSDKKSDIIFKCFGIWHIIYLVIILGSIVSLCLIMKNKSYSIKEKLIPMTINIALGLYILDFFLMPFAYGEIDLEKLPFHICTLTCVLCFLSRHVKFLENFKHQFAILGLISNFIYLVYPAGVGWYMIHPLSYRVIQTLLFHGVMTAYGIFTFAFEEVNLNYKSSYKELIIITLITLWALLGNTLYNGTKGDYSHFFNWFFVVRDPFYILPEGIACFIMPPFMIIFVYLLVLLTYSIINIFKKRKSQ